MNFNVDRVSLHYTLRLTITCTLVVAIYQTFQLHNGYWAAFSILGCIFPTSGQSFRRIKQRIGGTFFGMILGILIAYVAGNHWLYLDILIPLIVFLTVYLKAFNYTFYALFNTIISVALVCLIAPGDWQIALTRMEMTLLGCLLAFLATHWIFPNHASDTLPEKIQQIRQMLKHYYHNMLVHPDDIHSRITLFESLQQAKSSLQETSHESWRRNNNLILHDIQYEKLECIYHTLFLLELELPKNIESPELQSIAKKLQSLLSEAGKLFDSNSSSKNILQSLQLLATQLNSLRITAAKDASIPIATFREHIQLTETLKQLSILSTLLDSTSANGL